MLMALHVHDISQGQTIGTVILAESTATATAIVMMPDRAPLWRKLDAAMQLTPDKVLHALSEGTLPWKHVGTPITHIAEEIHDIADRTTSPEQRIQVAPLLASFAKAELEGRAHKRNERVKIGLAVLAALGTIIAILK
jgi:hypothetical protein